MSKHFSFDAEAEDDSDVVFRDVITLALLGFVSLVVIMLPHINPPKQKQEESKEVSAPGNVIVEARWDDRVDADVDLWVQAPGTLPSAIPTSAARSSTCCGTTSASATTRPT